MTLLMTLMILLMTLYNSTLLITLMTYFNKFHEILYDKCNKLPQMHFSYMAF